MPQEEKSFLSTEGLTELITKIKSMTPGGGGGSTPYTNHNGGIRGKNLGSTFTAEQKAAIAAGTFDDIYVGDYWEIDGVKYVIVEIDYYYNYGRPTATTDHHVIVLPDKVLSSQGAAIDSNYYGASSIYTTQLPIIAQTLETKFGQYLIDQAYVLHDSSGEAFWGHGKCILASFTQFQGYNQFIPIGKEQHKASQFSYFRYKSDLIASDQRNWLRDANGTGDFGFAAVEGSIGLSIKTGQYYLRPYFALAGVEQSQE